jgi:predicted DNA-binding antitoxin AbrB/MazE fold protein
MSKSLQAVYENGVLRPLQPLQLKERQQVAIVITESASTDLDEDWLDTDCLALYASDVDESITLEEVRKALAKIPGSLTADFIAERDEK